MAEVFLGLGSNLGEPADNLREAVTRLGRLIMVGRISSVYRTEPVGLRDQPFFLNAALRGRSDLEPRDMLTEISAIEDAMGRQRDVPGGARTIDIDLLLYGDRSIAQPGLTVPHPRMAVRRFVLAPLAEIAPDVRLAGSDQTAAELLEALPAAESVERIALRDWPPPACPV